MRYLCTIEDVFQITGRGCVIVPGVPKALPLPLRLGTKLLVRQPNGKTMKTTLHGVEMIHRGRLMDHVPISFPPHVRKDDLIIGSQVFALD